MELVEKEKIGTCIAWTGDHSVYEYGMNEVIKFSKFDVLLGYEKAKVKSLAEYEIFKSFFGVYILETRVASTPDMRRVALIQEKIPGRFLSKDDLQDEHIREQFVDLMNRYRELLKEGHPVIDLIGSAGAFVGKMGNVFVTPDNRLVIFDATLLALNDFPAYTRIFLWPLFLLARTLQASTIRAFEMAMKT